MTDSATLLLRDGSRFDGISIGASGIAVGEVVFNTAMTGYQEILTDPSYAQQIVTLTYPHIGNTGVNDEDVESDKVYAAALVIRDLPALASSWRHKQSLSDYLTNKGVVAIAGIDTRRLTRHLRSHGVQDGVLFSDTVSVTDAQQMLSDFSGLKGKDLAQQVSTVKPYQWQVSDVCKRHVIAFDFGIKHNILRNLAQRDCCITVVPAKTTADVVLAYKPDGIFLSNGPGDPEPCDYAIQTIRQLLPVGLPIFGICLGHQLLGLASGARTMKMKFGHHGANHPVLDMASKRVMLTSQNHGFCIDAADLPKQLEVTHLSLFDRTIQGVRHKTYSAFSFQGHPEASPGPHDARTLFDDFIDQMES
ncbi:MAG: glutamine-hydrolyzing carbamoyl-phosphate synthase small subunit [Chromatiales bacterium]|nr:glutamine-hydrolyzing carbamoyl-phosphate synthase small subunit [Chromatiales bacterium]